MKVTLKQILDLKPCNPERVKHIANHHFAGRDEVDLQEVIVLPEIGGIDTSWLASSLLPEVVRVRINQKACLGTSSSAICFCKCPTLHEFKEIVVREINESLRNHSEG